MLHINKIKTLNGYRYAVVEEFTSVTTDKNGDIKKTTAELPLEYKRDGRVEVAIFPCTEEGLAQAKKIQKILKK